MTGQRCGPPERERPGPTPGTGPLQKSGIAKPANFHQGNAPSYYTVHRWVSERRGRAAEHPCVDCGRAASAWSFDGSDAALTCPHTGRAYCADITAYSPRCSSCHAAYDGVAARLSKPTERCRKLTDDAVRELRAAHAAGESVWSIARRYGVTEGYCRDVATYRARCHVGGAR